MPLSPQQLHTYAHQLVKIWVQLHNDAQSDERTTVWQDNFPIFNKILEECGNAQQLDEVIKIALDDALIHYAEDIEDDEGEAFNKFHDFVFGHLGHRVQLEDDEVTVNHTEIGAIPLFGTYSNFADRLRAPEFVRLLVDSRIVPATANVAVLGLAPIGFAQMYMLEAQHLYNTVRTASRILSQEDIDDEGIAQLDAVAGEWMLTLQPEQSQQHAYSGFVLVFAYSSKETIDTEPSGLQMLSDEHEQAWEEHKSAWKNEQGTDLDSTHIGAPLPLRSAVAAAMADFALQNLLLQHSFGMTDVTIGELDVVAPWSEEQDDDDDFELDVNARTTVYGFTQEGELMGQLTYNAVVMSLLLPEIAHCWENWVGVRPTFFTHDEHARHRTPARRVLH